MWRDGLDGTLATIRQGVAMQDIIVRDPEILGGEPVFRGTRVPFQALLDYLEDGKYSLDDFLDQFPTVTQEMAVEALELGKKLVLQQVG